MVPGPLPRCAAGDALKRALLFAGAAVLAAAIAFCTISPGGAATEVPAQVHGRAAFEAHGQGPLRAAGAKVKIPLGEGAALAGYPGHQRAGPGGEEVYARAVAVEAGGVRAFIALIDTLLITGELEEQVLRRASLGPQTCLLLAATHTHSGPGSTWDNFIAGWAGTGAFDIRQREAIASSTADALVRAAAALAPAKLLFAREEWPAGPARARSEGPIDTGLTVARVRNLKGAEIATLVDYAMHPTSAPRPPRISADWPGQTAAALEGAPVLVLEGAVGNTTWSGPDAGLRVAQETAALFARAEALQEVPLACETRLIALPRAQASRRVPWLLRRAVSNVLALGFERHAVQTRIHLGPLSLVGVPGEPVGEIGLRARPDVLVSLADGYFGYLETPERWQRGEGESGKTYFGPGLARALGLAPR